MSSPSDEILEHASTNLLAAAGAAAIPHDRLVNNSLLRQLQEQTEMLKQSMRHTERLLDLLIADED